MKITLEATGDFKALRTVVKQLPFATALALTRTAQDVQTEERRELAQRFTLRNNWVSNGIRIKAATKANPEAIVFQKDDFMVLQETGGTKHARGKSLAIPEAARTNKRGIVTAGNRPNALKGKRGIFRKTIRGTDGLWQRRGRKRVPIRLLFVFKPSVQVPPRFGFIDTAKRTTEKRLPRQFALAFERAIKTAR